jgi:hypothetical protein
MLLPLPLEPMMAAIVEVGASTMMDTYVRVVTKEH